jgi:hypothetical protein
MTCQTHKTSDVGVTCHWLLWCLDFIMNRTIIFINTNIFFCAFNQCVMTVRLSIRKEGLYVHLERNYSFTSPSLPYSFKLIMSWYIKMYNLDILLITDNDSCIYLCSSGNVSNPLSHFVHFTSAFSVGGEMVSIASRTKRNRWHKFFDEMPPSWGLLWKKYNHVHNETLT